MSKNKELFERVIKVIDSDDPAYINKYIKVAEVFLEIEGLQDVEDIEDICEGPHSGVSLDDAVNKLMFELKNDPSLYKGYKDNLSRVIYDRIIKDSNFSDEEVPSIIEETIREITDDAAEDFLDEYISLIKE